MGDCAVFNFGGNKYRLIVRILHVSQKVFILKVMTHKEYDQDAWKEQCGCFAPLPEPKDVAKGKASKQQRKGR